jgi:predicted nucleic acid-binding protein
VINLNATGCAGKILQALPYRVAIVDIVADEIRVGSKKNRNDADKLSVLLSSKLMEVVSLSAVELSHFENLTVGAASETLDDGEAATIAHAAESVGVAVIDERKASRMCSTRFPELRVCSTVDLLAHPEVQSALGPMALADAAYHALLDARMRVLPGHLQAIVELIGSERAAQCVSLPRSVRKECS